METITNGTFIDFVHVDSEVTKLFPDYAAYVVAVDGFENAASDEESRRWLSMAGEKGEELVDDRHLEAWRNAFRKCGINPRRHPSSIDALMQRSNDLPAINKAVDAYNCVSLRHQIPIGGEDSSAYAGMMTLKRASGNEVFSSTRNGQPHNESVEAGEIVWADSLGVTSRRWNWRQTPRTQITLESTSLVFVLERLEPITVNALVTAADELVWLLKRICGQATATSRLLLP